MTVANFIALWSNGQKFSVLSQLLVAILGIFCYDRYGATLRGRRLPSFIGGFALQSRERRDAMVTYDSLFQFGLLIVAIVSLVYKISHKK